MVWQEPKTNWGQNPDDGVTAADMNRIEGNIKYAMDLVVPGKQLVKQAIVDSGGNVISEVPTFEELAASVDTIFDGTDAVASDILVGKKALSKKQMLTGTMPNRGAINNTITTQGGQITIPKGYHNGIGVVKAQITNLIASNIKGGVNVGGVIGTLTPSIDVFSCNRDTTKEDGFSHTFSVSPEKLIVYGATAHNDYTDSIDYTVINSLPWSGEIKVIDVSSGTTGRLTRITKTSDRTLKFTIDKGTGTRGVTMIVFAIGY